MPPHTIPIPKALCVSSGHRTRASRNDSGYTISLEPSFRLVPESSITPMCLSCLSFTLLYPALVWSTVRIGSAAKPQPTSQSSGNYHPKQRESGAVELELCGLLWFLLCYDAGARLQ